MRKLFLGLALLSFCGCVGLELTSGRNSYPVFEKKVQHFDKQGYYKGYSKQLRSGRWQHFDERGYYVGQTR